jgi:para-nitrobenzyl esterase
MRITRIAGAMALAAAIGACGRGADPALDPLTRRSLKQVEVVGAVGPLGNHVWRGIPFAHPPTGERRWRAPQPLEGWAGVREALRDGPACPQRPPGQSSSPLIGSEDCLYLNVFAPPFAPGEVPIGSARLPVMVWIHGGGNSLGSAAPYDAGRLAQEHKLIVFAVQYRLGILGWFRHAALRDPGGNEEDASGNYGTLDLLEALRWVHNNASEFGGDPERITVFGESAGGRNVYSLLLAPSAGRSFQRAIVQSGALELTPAALAENPSDAPLPGHANSSAEVVARLLVAHAGAADRKAALERAAQMPTAELAKFLRERSAEEILRAMSASGGGSGLSPVQFPQIFGDGSVLPSGRPLELLAQGRYHKLPLILGTNRDEWKLFQAADPAYVGRRLGFLPYVLDAQRYERDARYRSDVWRLNSVDAPAPILRSVQGPSVWAYRFDWDELPQRPWANLPALIGAAHVVEVPFVFGNFEMDFLPIPFGSRNAARDELSARMMSYWAQFAYTGDPGRGRAGTLPHWTAWDDSGPEAPRSLIFDTDADGGVRMSAQLLTPASLASALASDPRFASPAERCAMLASLRAWHDVFRAEDIRAVGCADATVAAGGN